MAKAGKQVTFQQARKTTLIVAAVAGSLSILFAYRSRWTSAGAAGTAAVILALVGLLVPAAAIIFHRGWMWIAVKLGWVNSRILLTLLYFFLFVPYKIVSRFFGRDPLSLRGPAEDSYWHKRERTRQTPEQFERLF